MHYPSDVIGGLIIGTCAGVIGTLISENVIPKKYFMLDFYKPKEKKPGKHQAPAA